MYINGMSHPVSIWRNMSYRPLHQLNIAFLKASKLLFVSLPDMSPSIRGQPFDHPWKSSSNKPVNQSWSHLQPWKENMYFPYPLAMIPLMARPKVIIIHPYVCVCRYMIYPCIYIYMYMSMYVCIYEIISYILIYKLYPYKSLSIPFAEYNRHHDGVCCMTWGGLCRRHPSNRP